MQRAAAAGANIIDIIALPVHHRPGRGPRRTTRQPRWGKYKNRLKIGGVKITIDGSPQGRTAFFTTPYLTGGPGGEKNWKGELAVPAGAGRRSAVKKVYDLGVPLNLHANGDAAIDVLLRAHEYAAAGDLDRDRRDDA